MNNSKSKRIATVWIPGILALLLSGHAMADWSWSFTGASSGGTSGLTFAGSGGAPNVTATAWSNSNYASGSSSSSYGTGDLVQRDIYKYSGGLGTTSPDDVGQGSPEHSNDNQYRIDSILLYFGGAAVTMSQVQFGWVSGDSDFSMSAYTGGGSTDLSSMEYADLASNGWTTIGSYYNPGTGSTAVNPTEISSSYWLISALNPDLGGTSNSNYYGNDFFKLAGAVGVGPSTTTDVPEPSTLLLLGGMLLLLAMRRRVACISRRGEVFAIQV